MWPTSFTERLHLTGKVAILLSYDWHGSGKKHEILSNKRNDVRVWVLVFVRGCVELICTVCFFPNRKK